MNKLIIATGRMTLLLILLISTGPIAVTANSNVSILAGSAPRLSTRLAATGPTTIYLPLLTKNYYPPAPLWRFGSARTRKSLATYDPVGLPALRLGWYVDFGAYFGTPPTDGMEYVPTVRVKQLKWATPDHLSKSECCPLCDYVAPDGPPEPDSSSPSYNYLGTPTPAQAAALAASHTGKTWLIGNEMDRIDAFSGNFASQCNRQDEMTPKFYAQVYHDYYAAIKTADPTARIAIGGITEFTPLRRKYLQAVWDSYQQIYGQTMPVDVWNIHMYILREEKDGWGADIPAGFDRNDPTIQNQGMIYQANDVKNFSIAWGHIVNLRSWMKDNGQQEKPLIITEYGILFPDWVDCATFPDTTNCPFTAQQVRDDFMYPSFNTFLAQPAENGHVISTDLTSPTFQDIGFSKDGYRLVQRWNWFSLDFDARFCDGGQGWQILGGSLFYSGANTPCGPGDFPIPPLGITSLGTYWQQYVSGLTSGANQPYTP